jgi:hypothetical protein
LQLAAAPQASDERKQIQGAMVDMEHLERDVAAYAAMKAATFYKGGNKAEADFYRRLTEEAADHAVLWMQRNTAESVRHFMDLEAGFRVSEVKFTQGELARTFGDDEAPVKAHNIGSTAVCAMVKSEDMKAILRGGGA